MARSFALSLRARFVWIAVAVSSTVGPALLAATVLPDPARGVLIVAAAGVGIWRGARVSANDDGTAVTIHNPWRSYTINWSAVSAIVSVSPWSIRGECLGLM